MAANAVVVTVSAAMVAANRVSTRGERRTGLRTSSVPGTGTPVRSARAPRGFPGVATTSSQVARSGRLSPSRYVFMTGGTIRTVGPSGRSGAGPAMASGALPAGYPPQSRVRWGTRDSCDSVSRNGPRPSEPGEHPRGVGAHGGGHLVRRLAAHLGQRPHGHRH